MKFTKTLSLVIGLLALSGVSQAQFSSTITGVSDYDFRGFSQSAKNPAIQASADYSFGDSGFAMGAWASNVKFDDRQTRIDCECDGVDADIELDIYGSYTGKVNDTFSWSVGFNRYNYPSSDDVRDYNEFFAGLTAGNFGFKQWYANKLFGGNDGAFYSEVNYTQPIGDKFSLVFHGGYAFGDAWKDHELFDYGVTFNWMINNFTVFAKFTGTDASGGDKITTDANNNEARVLVGVMTTLPWK